MDLYYRRNVGIISGQFLSDFGSNETIFKNSLSIFDDLDSIRIDSLDERQKVIQLFKDAGYQQWPDGRPLEQVIKRRGED